MVPYQFANRGGILYTFTEDYTSFSINPPLIYGTVDFNGGGRYVFELTDCEPGSVKTGMPVDMSFRRKYVDEMRGITGYFWKATPVRV